MAKRTGLGKGLDSLISTKYAEETQNSQELSTKPVDKVDKPVKKTEETPKETPEVLIRITLIEPNRNQPRKEFDKAALKELSESISIHGMIQPIIVKPSGKRYEIIAGERRWRAAKMAGLKEVPVIIRDIDEAEATEIALIENIQRQDLNPMEEAQAYDRLIKEFHLKQEELAKRVSKSRTAIANTLRLLKLTAPVQELVSSGQLSEGHARALLGLEDAALQETAAREIIEKGYSVRETEALVKKLNNPTVPKEEPAWKKEGESDYRKLETDLRSLMNTKVVIHRDGEEKGKIQIEYYSLEELERLTELFRKGSES